MARIFKPVVEKHNRFELDCFDASIFIFKVSSGGFTPDRGSEISLAVPLRFKSLLTFLKESFAQLTSTFQLTDDSLMSWPIDSEPLHLGN